MSGISEAKRCGAANVEERSAVERGFAERTERADVEWVDTADLRAATPEVLQLFAATGC